MTTKTKKNLEPELAPATISEHDGVRYLHLGTPWVQGAMRLKTPAQIELEYVQRMMAWMLLRPSTELARGHAVQLGLGAGAITRFTHGVMKMNTTVVELNPTVIGVNRAYFRLPAEGPRFRVLAMDAQRWVDELAEPGSVDVLCVDLYDHEAAGPVLDSEDFYRGCARVLAEGGVMSVNLFGRHASFARSARRIAAAFADGAVVSLQPTREGNTIVLAIKQGSLPDRDELAARAQQVDTRYGLPARKWLRMIRPLPDSVLQPA